MTNTFTPRGGPRAFPYLFFHPRSGRRLLALLASLLAGFAHAQSPETWQVAPWVKQTQLDAGLKGGEGGQWPQAIAIDPVDGTFLLFGSDVGGLARSLDGGATWTQSNLGFSARGTSGFAIDPNNINRVLTIGANGTRSYHNAHGVYLSTDKGVTWSISFGTNELCGYRDIREQIAYDKSSYNATLGYSTVAYWSRDNEEHCQGGFGTVTVTSALYKSTDGGATWNILANTSAQGGGIVKVHPTLGYVYVANENGFFRSIDGGTSFTKTFTPAVTGMDVVIPDPNKVFITAADGLYVSINSGGSFTKVASTTYPANVVYVNVSPVNRSRMVIQSRRGGYDAPRYYSHDGGATWTEVGRDNSLDFLPWNGGREGYVAWHPTDQNKLWTFGGDWITASTNGGATLKWANNGFSAVFIASKFNFSTTSPNVVMMPSKDYDAAVTADGNSWKYLGLSGNGWGGYIFGGYSSNGLIAFGANDDNGTKKIAITRDGGTSSVRTNVVVGGSMVGYGDPNDSRIFFMGNQRSVDEGLSWSTMTACDGVFISNSSGAKELYGHKGRNIIRSLDRGATWTTLGAVLHDISDLAYDPGNNRVYVACGDNGLFQLDVTPGTVTDISTRIPADQFGNRRFFTVAVDPTEPNIVYAGGARHIYNTDVSVARSTDGGVTWIPLTRSPRHNNPQFGNDGGREAEAMRVNPWNRDLHVGTNCYGMWKIGAPAATGSGADLVVTNITYTPATPVLGTAVTFRATVRNKGNAATPAGTAVRVNFLVNGTPVTFSDNYTTAIPAGGEVTVTANGGNWTATVGTHTLRAVVDPAGTITERNETNNALHAFLKVVDPAVPTPPGNLRLGGRLGATTIPLAWNAATDDVAVTGYRIYNGSTLAATVGNVTTATVTGLDPVTPYSFTVKAIDGGNRESDASNVANLKTSPVPVASNLTTTAVTIDGQLSEANWQLRHTAAKTVIGSGANNTVTFGTLWDATNLYVAVKVLDANLYNTDWRNHNNDGIEIYVDGNHNRIGYEEPSDVTYGKIYNGTGFYGSTNRTGVVVQSALITGGYSVEFRIPWSTLGVTSPAAGMTLGFDLANNDDDAGTLRSSQLVWTGTANNWQTTADFGALVLNTDTQAPTAPANLAASGTPGQNSVNLTWSASTDNVGVTGYNVYNGTTLMKFSGTTSTTVTGLSPATNYSFTVKALDNGGNESAASNAVSVRTAAPASTSAKRISSTITVNGALAEADWNLATSATKAVSGVNNNTTTFSTLWDATNLYVAVKVLDANLHGSAQYWNTDAVEVYVDADNNGGASYDARDRQYIKVFGDTTLYSSQSKTGVQHAVAAITGGYTVEMAIPWTNLGITPTENMVIGFDVANNDDDTGGGRTVQTVWNGTADNWFNTSAFGDLTLAGAGTNPAPTWTKVDNANAAVTYSGTDWGTYSGNGGYLNTEHYSETTGAVATYTFTGTQARFYGFKRNDLGHAEILVDNVLRATVDLYNASMLVDQLLFESETLAPGTHTLKVRVKGTRNAASSGTEVIVDAFAFTNSATGCTASGTILREQWNSITGGSVHNLTGSPNYPNSPSSSGQLTIFEGPTNVGDNYGSRIRGYVCAPETGNYTFWIASDDNSELWLSTSDNPGNKVLIASINGWAGVREWTKYTTQQSVAVALTAGQRYYIEALHKEGSGGDNLAVGWQLPSGTLERPIPGARLSPWVNGARQATDAPAESPDERLRVFPVPARDRVTVVFRAEAAGEAVVQVYDGLARRKLVVKTLAVRGENKLELATGTLEDGLYLLQVTTGTGTLTRKLVTRQ